MASGGVEFSDLNFLVVVVVSPQSQYLDFNLDFKMNLVQGDGIMGDGASRCLLYWR